MSYTITVNRNCDRCPREERTQVTVDDVVKLAKGGPKGPAALEVTIDGKPTVEFGFLCEICHQIVGRYLSHAAKRPKHQSALRGSEKVEVEEDE